MQERRVRKLDLEKHILEGDRLNQTLNGKLLEASSEIRSVMHKYNIDSMPGIAFDVCRYSIEEEYLNKLNIAECPEELKSDDIREMQVEFQSYLENWSKSKRASFSV